MKLSITRLVLLLAMLTTASFAVAHGVDDNTRTFLQQNTGVQFVPFLYIGAKHMITGYDHLLFLLGVIFFLFRSREVLLYVSLFTLGHSITLMSGVLANIQAGVLVPLLEGFAGALRAGGWLILSGITEEEWLGVSRSASLLGFGLEEVDEGGDWRSGWLTQR